ncbi:MAG: hypothetical protein JXA25_17250 [Anaerolineales bacterium]|nr:hypothetical protein [Anaerolineales bacterium]
MKSRARAVILIFTVLANIPLVTSCGGHPDATVEPAQEAPPTPTAVPYKVDDTAFAMQAEFDQASDLNFFDVHGHDGELMPQEDILMANGSLEVSNQSASWIQLAPPLKQGIAIHLRWKSIAENGMCHEMGLSPMSEGGYDIPGACSLTYSACSGGSLELNTAPGCETPLVKESEGLLLIESDNWLEMVLWLDKDDPGRVNIFSWNADYPERYSATTAFLPGSAPVDDFRFGLASYGMTLSVDTFELILEGIESYLWFNAPAFSAHYDNVMALYRDFAEETAVVPADSPAPAADVTSAANSQEIQAQESAVRTDEEMIAELFAALLQPEDLPQDLGLTATREDAYDSLEDLRLSRTLLQEPAGTSGGLEITSEATVHQSEFRNLNDLMQTVGFDIDSENMRIDAPEVGAYSLSFFRSPFERYLASRGSISVDIYCRNILSGIDPYCTPENLSALAGLMLDRMPVVDIPPLLEFGIPEQSSNTWFDYFNMDDPLSMNIQWQTRESLPSMEIFMVHEDLQQAIYWVNCLDMAGAEPGSGNSQIRPGQEGDNENMPMGNYHLFVIVRDEIAYEGGVPRE